MTEVDVLVVGGGPAGLAAAVALRRAGTAVTLVEREAALGGIARHADHTGYGLREFKRLMRGPAYARAWAARAERAGIDLRTESTVTGWAGRDAAERTVTVTSPSGIETVRARAVLLATGTRERPRSARLVPGTRPAGVLTTGALQQLVALGLPVGERAVIVGAEHVSFSAVLTLRHHGVTVAAMTTPESRHQSYAALRAATAGRHRVPVLTSTAVTRIAGRRRVEAVELTDLARGETRELECDTVVFTGDWIPDHELARRGQVTLDHGTRAPRVDAALGTRAPGVFAAGNLLHGAETAGVCASSGAWAAMGIARWLGGDADQLWAPLGAVPIECSEPLRWISPNAIVPGQTAVPHGHFLLRTDEVARAPRLVVRQGSNELWSGRVRRAIPSMPVHLPARWLGRVEAGEPVRVAMAG